MISILQNKYFKMIASIVFWLLIWQLVALKVGKELIFPGPFMVLERLVALIWTGEFWFSCLHTLLRIVSGYLLGVVLGLIFAILTSYNEVLNAIISPMIKIIRSTPVASFIILALLWMGKNSVPFLIVVLMVIPIVWENVCAEFNSVDKDLIEMAKAYRFSKWKTLLKIYIPSSLPGLQSACLTAMGLAWKSGIAAEVLAQPSIAIGTNLYYSKIYLETSELFAWTMVVIVLSWLIEKTIRHLIEGRIKHENN